MPCKLQPGPARNNEALRARIWITTVGYKSPVEKMNSERIAKARWTTSWILTSILITGQGIDWFTSPQGINCLLGPLTTGKRFRASRA